MRRTINSCFGGAARRGLGIGMAALMLIVPVGCSSDTDRLSEELVASTSSLVLDRAAAASVDLGESDAECVARRLTDEQANRLARAIDDPGLEEDLASTLAGFVLACVDPDQLTRSAIMPFAQGASDESVECITGRLNEDLIESLIEANLLGVGLPAAQVELELATALGLCLEPDELLNRG
ncbi:MAG: hypothetical protein R2710_17365 [Acidimicrobiales bacterium]